MLSIISKAGGYLASNLGGLLGKKWVMIVIATLMSVQMFIITTFQNQKEDLRENLITVSSQLTKEQAEHIAELKAQTEKHNKIVSDMINNEEKKRLQIEIDNLKRQKEITEETNAKFKSQIEELKKYESNDYFTKCPIPEDIKNLLNTD